MNRQGYGWVYCLSLIQSAVSGRRKSCSFSDGGATETVSTDYYTVGGSVSGYSGSGLVLQNISGDELPISLGVFATTWSNSGEE